MLSSFLESNPEIDQDKRSIATAINFYKRIGRAAIKKSNKSMSLLDWSSKNVRLSGPRPGPFDISLTPHMLEPYLAASLSDKVTDIILMFGSQLGKSTFCEIATGFYMVAGTGNIGYGVANDELLKRIREVRVNKILEQVPELQHLLQQVKDEKGSKNAKNEIKLLNFGKAYLCFMSMQSTTAMSNIDCQILILEEVRDAPVNLKGQGCPVKIIDKRRSTYDKRSKRIISSTPALKSENKELECKVYREFLEGSQEYWSVPCPHCEHYHQLEVKNAVIDKENNVFGFVCPSCGCLIEECHRDDIVRRGKYIARNPAQIKRFRSFHNNQFMTMQSIGTSWEKNLRAWEKAQDKEPELITFTNTVLGLPYSKVEKETSSEILKLNQGAYLSGSLPDGVTHITAGFDFQKTWVECTVWGWDKSGRQYFCERVKQHNISWEDVEGTITPFLVTMFNKVYSVSNSLQSISGGFLDIGYQAEKVAYAWLRAGRNNSFKFIKGESKYDDSKVFLGKSFLEKGSLKLPFYRINTFAAKDNLVNRFELPMRNKGSLIFPVDVDEDIFNQLTSEIKTHSSKSGKAIWELKNSFVRNEVLDCTVYAGLAHDILISDFQQLTIVEETQKMDNDKSSQVNYNQVAKDQSRIPSAFD